MIQHRTPILLLVQLLRHSAHFNFSAAVHNSVKWLGYTYSEPIFIPVSLRLY